MLDPLFWLQLLVWNKVIFKNLLSYLGLPVTPYLVVVEEDYKNQGSKLIRKLILFSLILFCQAGQYGFIRWHQ